MTQLVKGSPCSKGAHGHAPGGHGHVFSKGGHGHPPFGSGQDGGLQLLPPFILLLWAKALEPMASTIATADPISFVRFAFMFFSCVWKSILDKRQGTLLLNFFLSILKKFTFQSVNIGLFFEDK